MERLSHAYIYAGPRGLGKYQAALELAKRLTDNNVADIIDVTNERYGVKTTVSGGIAVQTIRAARNDVYVRPYSNKKVIIINNADGLNQEGQNSLLKVIEEPPNYCIFILIAENENKLLPTIRSRSVIKRFAPISDDRVAAQLGASGSKAEIAVLLAGGSVNRAQELLEDENLEETYKKTLSAIKGLTCHSSRNLYKAIAFFEENKEQKELLFDITRAICRKILLYNEGKGDKIEFVMPQRACIKFLEELEALRIKLKQNGNYSMMVTAWLMRGRDSFGRD